jgi:putative PEP-CTERM system histidine kinase
MSGLGTNLVVVGHALAAAAHLATAFLVWRVALRDGQAERRLFVGALLASAAWAAAVAWNPASHSVWPGHAAMVLDVLRHGLWLLLLHRLMHGGPGLLAWPALPAPARALAVAAGAVVVFNLVQAGAAAALGSYLDSPSRHQFVGLLMLAVMGALLLEQLYRNLVEELRWHAKPLVLSLAVVFGFDIVLFAEAALVGQPDGDLLAIRGLVHSLVLPILLVAARRRVAWNASLQVSHAAAFFTATLVLVGLYLLFIAGVGTYVRVFGGQWGRALQIALLMAAVLGLAVIVLSASLRARLRVLVNKHFFSYRYDYRQEWLRFTAMLSAERNPQAVGGLIARGLADMVESPGAALWTRTAGSGAPGFRQTARWNSPEVLEAEAEDSELAQYMQQKAWVIDLQEYRESPRLYGQLTLPLWLLNTTQAWLVVPLLVGEEMIGFVTLQRPRTPMEVNWEVRDLLKTASRQAASFLSQMQTTEALLEARKFEAFNRMSAFVVHDLKNIITQLSLMLKNAERLRENPEFQQDMLLTVESSLEKMRRLMLQLREGAAPPGGAVGVALGPILQRLQDLARSRGRAIELRDEGELATRGHDDRLERVLGHLVANALDATPPQGQVWLAARRQAGQVIVEVGDSGSGMSKEHIKERLFRPFASTKRGGMGIGLYESAQYVAELGGRIDVQSELGQGTVITVSLPAFDLSITSDLQARRS